MTARRSTHEDRQQTNFYQRKPLCLCVEWRICHWFCVLKWDLHNVACLQLEGADLWPTSVHIPSSSLVTIHVTRKPGTALGMSIAGGRGSDPFIGNDEVIRVNDAAYSMCTANSCSVWHTASCTRQADSRTMSKCSWIKWRENFGDRPLCISCCYWGLNDPFCRDSQFFTVAKEFWW